MSFETLQQRMLPLIEKELEKKLWIARDQLSEYNAEMSAYQLSTGGKRLRALIPLMVFQNLESDPLKALPIGAAAEFLHNATLVHDDIQDGDEYRRNEPTVWKRYSMPQAINCGNALFQFATLSILESDLDAKTKNEILALASKTTLQVIEGQAQEFLIKDSFLPNVEQYIDVVIGKTSGYFIFPFCAALLALKVSAQDTKAAIESVTDLGIAFQIQDDIIDLYGEKGRDRRGSDIAEGKVSIFVAHINQSEADLDKMLMTEILKKDRSLTTDHDIELVEAVFEKNESLAFAQKEMARYIERAMTRKFENSRINDAITSLKQALILPRS